MAKVILVLVLMSVLVLVGIDVVPCDHKWATGPSFEEIIQELEKQNGPGAMAND